MIDANKREKFCLKVIITVFILLIFFCFLIYRKKETKKRLVTICETKKTSDIDIINAQIEYDKKLTNNILQLIERDELLDKFCDYLEKTDDSECAKSLISLRRSIESNNWNEFNQRFISTHKDFYKLLEEKYPLLTPTDLKHCALIKLNFSGREMSNILGISEKSAHMARYRIRKKLELDSEVNLSTFLSEF